MDRQVVLALVLQILLIITKQSEGQHEAAPSWPATDVIHLSPLAVKSMPYRDFRIKFYLGRNHLLNGNHTDASAGENQQPPRYFYTPVGSLDHRSAVSYHNNVTGESELRFVIHLWDDELEETIAEYLGNVLKTPVRKEDLEVIPFQRIYLKLNAKLQEMFRFESRKSWTHYYVQEKYIWPTIKCPTAPDCNRMAEQMRLNPTQFSDCFQLKFLMEPQQRSTELLKKEISVKASNIVLGRLYRRVESKFPRQNYVLLTPLDTRQLIFESINQIISQNFDDRVVVDDSNMYASLKQLLVPSKQNMNGQSKNPSAKWDLLYWEQDENHRPDKLATVINEIYSLSDSNGKRKLIEVFRLISSDRSQRYTDSALSAMFEKFTYKTGDFPGEFEVEGPNAENNFNVFKHKTLVSMLKASGSVLKWTGKEFALKPREFSKLNLAKLRGRQADSRAMFKISVPYLEADMVMNPKIDVNFYWTPERDLKQRLQDALGAVDDKILQVETKMTSNYFTAIANVRDKMLHDYTTHYEALEENASKEIRQLHRWVAQEVSHLEARTSERLSEQTLVRNALIDSLERRLVNALQLSNEAHDDSLRQLREQLNRGEKLGRMPSSCRDLWTIGHSHTGYYMVKSNNKQHPIEILYCDMADRGNASSSSALQRDYSRADANEKWVGYSDVKTSPAVYFYAQRLTTFSQQGSAIPFQAEILNAGGAFRLPDGIFGAPTPGIYHFSFSGLRAAAYHFVHVSLQVNGKRVGSAYSGTPESNKVPYRPTSLSLQSVLELKRGDQVRLFLEAGAIGAETPCQDCVHFSGMLLTEYL